MKKIAMGLVLLIMAASCGGSGASYDKNLNGNPLVLLDKGTLAFTENEAKGSGKFIFLNPIPVDDSKSFEFSMRLLEDNSSVTVVTNADNKLENGLSIIFSREEKKLKVAVKLGLVNHDISAKFTSLKASDPLSFVIDVHAEESAHVLIWKKESSYTKDNTLFNSDEKDSGEKKKYAMKSKVTGIFWGFALNKAGISNPKVDKAKDHHH